MNTVLNDIISYEILVLYEPEMTVVQNCTFTRDFGPWKVGYFANFICIKFDECVVEEHYLNKVDWLAIDTGKDVAPIKVCKFSINPIN